MKDYQSAYPVNGLFAENLIHFLYSMHMIPAIETLNLDEKINGTVTLATSCKQIISTHLKELPPMEEKEDLEISKKMMELSTQIFLNDCFEKLKKQKLIDRSKIIELFRHIRNACSHSGKFHILNKKPKHKAEWRKMKITPKLHGSSLFDFFAVGDAILLIQDVEEHIKSEKTNWTFREE